MYLKLKCNLTVKQNFELVFRHCTVYYIQHTIDHFHHRTNRCNLHNILPPVLNATMPHTNFARTPETFDHPEKCRVLSKTKKAKGKLENQVSELPNKLNLHLLYEIDLNADDHWNNNYCFPYHVADARKHCSNQCSQFDDLLLKFHRYKRKKWKCENVNILWILKMDY